MVFKGTKGEWVYELFENSKGYFYKVISNTVSICNITTRNQKEAEANALLISKAPEMLEMLQKIVLVTERFKGGFSDFREKYNKEIEQLIKEATEI